MKTYVLGTSVEFFVRLDKIADEVNITIKDSVGNTKVDADEMIEIGDKMYTYVYQSNKIDYDGIYDVIVEAIPSSNNQYTSVSKTQIEFEEQP